MDSDNRTVSSTTISKSSDTSSKISDRKGLRIDTGVDGDAVGRFNQVFRSSNCAVVQEIGGVVVGTDKRVGVTCA